MFRSRHVAPLDLLLCSEISFRVFILGPEICPLTAYLCLQLCSEAAVVGFPHPIKGEAIYAFVTLAQGEDMTADLQKELKAAVRGEIGAFAAPDMIHWAPGISCCPTP